MKGNGTLTKIIFYLLGILQIGILFFMTYWVGKIDGIQSKIEEHQGWAAGITMEFEGRISALEAEHRLLRVQLDRIETLLISDHKEKEHSPGGSGKGDRAP